MKKSLDKSMEKMIKAASEKVSAQDVAVLFHGIFAQDHCPFCYEHVPEGEELYHGSNFHCTSCGREGNSLGMVAAMEDISTAEAAYFLNIAFGLGFKNDKDEKWFSEQIKLVEWAKEYLSAHEGANTYEYKALLRQKKNIECAEAVLKLRDWQKYDWDREEVQIYLATLANTKKAIERAS